jgi:hypothetical protein
MDKNDIFEIMNENDINYDDDYDNNDKKTMEQIKKMDRGYNVLTKKFYNLNGKLKQTKIEYYTSSGTGNHIRNAETGEYYNSLVGSLDEDLFFKVILSTNKCYSKNGSNTLFYLNPNHYMTHMRENLNSNIITTWMKKKNYRLNEM